MLCTVIIVPGTFLIKMVVVTFDTFYNLSAVWWLDFIYFTFFEFAPVGLLVLLSSTSQLVKPANVPLLDPK